MKIIAYKVKPMSKEGISHWRKDLKPYAKRVSVYQPLKPLIWLDPNINTKQKLARLIYESLGADEEGVTYAISYWRKVNRWSRRLKRLCMIKLWDRKDGSFGYKFLDMGMLRRFKWWKDK